jgi:CHASE2 domain-containing sensor protein
MQATANLRLRLSGLKNTLKSDWRCWAALLTSGLLGFVLLVAFDARDKFYHASYDWLLLAQSSFRSSNHINDVLLVSCDPHSLRELNEDPIADKDRGLHARLTDALLERGAKAVAFDIVFEGEGKGDAELARAISSRPVLLAMSVKTSGGAGQPRIETPLLPVGPICRAAFGRIGTVDFPKDVDGAIRRIPGTNALARRLVEMLNLRLPNDHDQLWLNYYGPPGSLPRKSYYQMLQPDLASGILSNKIVFVGRGGEATTSYGTVSDQGLTPYNMPADGIEIQATATLNLIRGEWIREFSPVAELLLTVGWGLAIALMLVVGEIKETAVREVPDVSMLRRTVAISGCGVLLLGCAGIFLFSSARLWLPWTIPLSQVGWGAVWAVWIAIVPPKPVPKPVYDVFISYRTRSASKLATLVQVELGLRNIKAYLDAQSLLPGKPVSQVLSEIESIPCFIFIVSENALDDCAKDSDWVRQEIRHALKTKRAVVPIIDENCKMPKRETLPPDIGEFANIKGLSYSHEYSKAAFDTLADRLRSRDVVR